MDMATFTKESTLNRQAFDKLREQIKREYTGLHVAMAHGKVVGSASTFDAARALVDRLENAPEYYLVFPANGEPDFGLIYDLSGSIHRMPSGQLRHSE
jgi:hypothetical protein